MRNSLLSPALLIPNEKPVDFSRIRVIDGKASYVPFTDSVEEFNLNLAGTLTGTQALKTDSSGQHFDFTGAERVEYPNFSPSLPAHGFVKFKRNAIGVWSRLHFSCVNDGSDRQYGINVQISSADILTISYGTGDASASGRRQFLVDTSGDELDVVSKEYTVAWCIRGATDASISINGVDKAFSTAGTGVTYDKGAGNGVIGAVFSSIWYYSDDKIYDAYMSEGNISSLEALDLSLDPYKALDSTVSNVYYLAAGGATMSANDATATRGQTDYEFTIADGTTWDGVSAIPGTATISDGVNTDNITMTDYPLTGNGVVTCTISSTIACLFDATGVLQFNDGTSGTPSNAVILAPESGSSWIPLTSPLKTNSNFMLFGSPSTPVPVTGGQLQYDTVTTAESVGNSPEADSEWVLDSTPTTTQTTTCYYIHTDGVRTASWVITWPVGSATTGFLQPVLSSVLSPVLSDVLN